MFAVKKISLSGGLGLFFLLFSAFPVLAQKDLAKYVNPFIGTGGHGHTYPGPSLPFGMIQPGPDTNGQKFCGYDHTDPMLHGFSMTHLSGTGWWDLGDFLFVPGTGEPKFDPGAADKRRYG